MRRYASLYSNDADKTLEQFVETGCESHQAHSRVPALADESALYDKRRTLSLLFTVRRTPTPGPVFLDQASHLLLLISN